MKPTTLRLSILLAGAFAATSLSVQAITITATQAPGTVPGFTGSSAYDDSTGLYYRRDSYNLSTFRVYTSRAAFEANGPSTNLTISGSTAGPYFEVSNGRLYTRSNTSTSAISVYNASTGATLGSSSIASMGGSNGTHTFNWGGYSGVNFMGDGNDLYLFGKNSSGGNWQVNELDSNLNVLSTTTFIPSAGLGWAFIINGTLFTSSYYNDDTISQAMDISTGLQSSVSFQILGLGSSSDYIYNADYHAATDTLWIHDLNDNRSFYVDNASQQFGVAGSSVPDGGSSALMLSLGLLGFGAVRRKLR